MSPFLRIVLFLAASAALAGSARAADTLYMKDGSVRLGKVIRRDSLSVLLQETYDKRQFPSGQVERIAIEPSFGPGDATQLTLEIAASSMSPSGIDFPFGFSFTAGVRYLLTRTFGVRAAIEYTSTQQGVYVPRPISNKETDTITEIFRVYDAAFLVGGSYVQPLTKRALLDAGLDIGLFSFGAGVEVSRSELRFGYGVHVLAAFAISERAAFEAAIRYRATSTTLSLLKNSADWAGKSGPDLLAPGPAIKVSQLMFGGGFEFRL